MLLHISEVLSRDQVRQLRSALDASDWTDGRETVGPQGAKVKRNQQLPDTSPLRQQLGNTVLSALAKPAALSRGQPCCCVPLPPRFNRYEGGGHGTASMSTAP